MYGHPRPNPIGALGIFATVLLAGTGVLGFARGASIRRGDTGLVALPPVQPGPESPTEGTDEPQQGDPGVTFVEPSVAEINACGGGEVECWTDDEGRRFCRCVGKASVPSATKPQGPSGQSCPPNYFYDALHDVCCPDGFFFDTRDGMCRPMDFAGNPASNP